MKKFKTLAASVALATLSAASMASAAVNTPDTREGVFYDASIQHQPADGVIRLYGPGGPHSALIKVAQAYEKKTGQKVEVIFGPEKKWSRDAQAKADIIFGSSEQSITAYLENYHFISEKDVQPVYIRRAVIAVKKGNPKNIQGFNDLLKEGTKVVVTEGKGVYNTSGTGVWEDIAGREGSLEDIQKLRQNIVAFEKGSGAGFKSFNEKADAWITWIDWPMTNPAKADYVDLDKSRTIYRDMNIAVSPKADPATADFVKYLNSDEGEKLVATLGWTR
ncbi:substrate-binding domain-containing protein [Endozoicomonas arenosclerae]|uniref:substrate-binding domain-containing protein n=1 Tax=Endozoicomonas arenosclerae TaxID=1633495 RepID=UPI000783797C|nr:substrate-binding domain-containing protein [Endozoicomonas arenosclerae]